MRLAALESPIADLAPSARPDTPQVVLVGLVLAAALVDGVRSVGVGGISGGGMLTLMGCAAAACAWLARPLAPMHLLRPLLPLVMFVLYAVGSLLWYSPGVPGLQQLAVYLSFLALILLSAREAAHRPQLIEQLLRWMLLASVLPVLLYLQEWRQGGMGADGWIGARSFALYALAPVAVALARWRFAGDRRCLAWAAVVAVVIFLSMSRTALVAALLLFPLAVALRGDRRSITAAVIALVGGGGLFITAIFSYQPLYDRFFANDATMNVGGVAINASGRTAMWNMVLSSIGNDWLCGKGVASSGNLIADYFPGLAQPHNDFLRFYYDFGAVGLSLWLAFLACVTPALFRQLRRALHVHNANACTLHASALLALVAVTVSMFTDNSVTYSFVMMPLGVLIGCSLGSAPETAGGG